MANLVCYRSEKTEWWPPPSKRLIRGLVAYKPWRCSTIGQVWNKLLLDLKLIPKTKGFQGQLNAYAQKLRSNGQHHVIASARTLGGAFSYECMYTITIPNFRTFRITEDYKLKKDTKFLSLTKIDNHYIVLNADSIQKSTILGFGHKTGTKEVTFMHGLHPQFITACTYNKKKVTKFFNLKDITIEEKIGSLKAAFMANPLKTPIRKSPCVIKVKHSIEPSEKINAIHARRKKPPIPKSKSWNKKKKPPIPKSKSWLKK